MTIDVPKQRMFGVVNWIGGFNKKKNRENDFGFIESIQGEDIFAHKSALVDSADISEGNKVSFICEQSDRGPKALDVRLVSISSSGISELLLELKEAAGSYKSPVYTAYLREVEGVFFSLQPEMRAEILQALFQDQAGRDLLNKFLDQADVYRHLLHTFSLEYLVDQGVALESLPKELMRENEEAVCRLICSGQLTEVSKEFVGSARLPILYACALVNLIDFNLLHGREGEFYSYLSDKFINPDGANAALYKEIFADCTKRVGGYQASPLVWDMLSELLLKKYLYERNFLKAESLYKTNGELSRKIDCFILFNLAQLIGAGNNLQTIYKIFVSELWQALANRQVDVEPQTSRILSLFPSCGTMRLTLVTAVNGRQNKDNDFDLPARLTDEPAPDKRLIGSSSRQMRETRLSCEAVYWEKQRKYLCRGSVCSNPQIQPDPTRHFLEFSIYDWFVHFGVEYWGSEDHQLRDFPIKLAGYLNRLREIMAHLRCRGCNELMLPDFKYSRVKCSIYENGRWIEKDMAAAYRNTLFYCNNESCSEHGEKYYINHCLGYLCFDLIDSRDLKVKCDNGLLVCKGCGGCCGEHAKANPVGFCSECGSPLELYEDPSHVSRFGRNERFVGCSNRNCSFEITEPGLPKKFYLDSCQPVHLVKGYV